MSHSSGDNHRPSQNSPARRTAGWFATSRIGARCRTRGSIRFTQDWRTSDTHPAYRNNKTGSQASNESDPHDETPQAPGKTDNSPPPTQPLRRPLRRGRVCTTPQIGEGISLPSSPRTYGPDKEVDEELQSSESEDTVFPSTFGEESDTDKIWVNTALDQLLRNQEMIVMKMNFQCEQIRRIQEDVDAITRKLNVGAKQHSASHGKASKKQKLIF